MAKDQIVNLCMMQRAGQIDLDEFGRRLATMLEDPDSLTNIAIDIEQLAMATETEFKQWLDARSGPL